MRDLTYPPVIAAAKTGFRLLGQRFDLRGTERVPRSGGVLLAYNHIGYVDFVYGGLAANPSRRLVRFMAKRELFDHALTGPLMRSLHHIEVDRAEGVASFRQAVDYLRAGEAVGIFPEATISRAMELKDFKNGAVRIAAEAGVPVLPVILWGTQRMMTKDHPRDFSRGKTIAIHVGEPLHPSGEDPAAETAELKAAMSALLDEAIRAYPAEEQPPGAWWLPASKGGSAPTLAEAAELDRAEKLERARRRAEKRAGKTRSGG
jgi:1-acyl-sn-glycerol-3-phosphate acyltransferase